VTAAVDLGHGTTEAYAGGPSIEPCSVWSVDGRRVVVPPRRLQALALSLHHGNREAAHRLGVAESTVKNLLVKLNNQLGTFSKWEAATALGWTRIPHELQDASPEVNRVIAGGRSVAGPLARARSAAGRGPA
jgi:hypothetical protein